MIKKLIFTLILTIILIFYSCMAAKPIGIFASLQDQENSLSLSQVLTQTVEAANNAKTEDFSSVYNSGSDSDSSEETENEETDAFKEPKKNRISFQSILSKITPKRIQLSLSEKSDQVLKVWTSSQSIHGVINVLQTQDFGSFSVNPSESLAPFNNNHKAISFLYLCLLGIIVLCKTAVSLSVPIICFAIIPIFIIYNIIALWKNNDGAAARILIASLVTSVIITIAVPAIMKISILADDYIFKKQVNQFVLLLEESENSARLIEADLHGGRKSDSVIYEHIAKTKILSNKVVKDSFSYILIFTVSFILIPVFASIWLCKLSRFISRKILRK